MSTDSTKKPKGKKPATSAPPPAFDDSPVVRRRTGIMLLTLIEALIDEHGWNPLATLSLNQRFANRYPLTESFTDEQLEDLRVLQSWTAISIRDRDITAAAAACGKPESKGDRECAYTEQSTHVVLDDCKGSKEAPRPLRKIALTFNPDSKSVRDRDITAAAAACGKPESKGDRECAYTEQSTHVVLDDCKGSKEAPRPLRKITLTFNPDSKSVRDRDITAAAAACGKPESKGDRECAYTEQSTHVVLDDCKGSKEAPRHLRKIALTFNPDSKDTYASSMGANQDIAFISGESFWLSVLQEPWDVLGKR
jgi:hypothetical protein